MKVIIRGPRAELTPALRTHMQRQLGFALSRFGAHIERVTIIAGDGGGPDDDGVRRYEVEVELRPEGSVRVEDTDADAFAAVGHAAARAARAVGRVLDRERSGERGPPGGRKGARPRPHR